MDYSSYHNDPDHPDNPAGSSPWQTSPVVGRTFDRSATDSAPPSPTPQQPGQDVAPPNIESEAAPPTPSGNQIRDEVNIPAEQQHPEPYAEEPEEEDFPVRTTRKAPRVMPDIRYQEAPLTEEEIRQRQLQQQRQQERQQQALHSQHNARGPTRYHQGGPQAARRPPQYRLQAKITSLDRTGKKDPSIRFDVHTNLPKFRTTQVRDIKRTHSEFQKLADHLISSNPEALVPALPPALTSAGAGTDEDELRTKNALQRWLNYICGNDVLMRDDEMVFFVESDAGYSPMIRMKQPATGVRRKVIKQFAPPPDDTPELQDARPVAKAFYLGTMECGQKIDKVVKSRRGLGLAESDLGVKLGQLHVQEGHPGLSIAYRKLGKIIQTIGDYHAAQGTAEATTLSDPFNYHSSDAFIVKETLTNRHILLGDLLSAQQATKSKLAAADRLKLDEARSNEEYLTRKTQRVTTNLLVEKRRWFARTAADLRTSIREYVLREIEAERRALAVLESVRPDVRSIDSSGGLSRLGREQHPAVRRASMQSSQGPKGDAWSGLPRRQGALESSINSLSGVKEEGGSSGGSGKVNGDGAGVGEGAAGQKRATSGTTGAGKAGQEEDGDDDRVDARNAASRLATSTF